jgi:PKD repeat protein
MVGNSQCNGSNTVSFINTSTGNIGSYLWSYSGGTVSTDFNPTITFANAGNYTAKLAIVSTGGCQDSITKSFTIFNKLVASFQLSSVTQCINNNSFTFTNTSNNTGLNSLQYKWDLGDGTLASTSVVTKSFLLSGTYNVKLVVTNPATGCSDSITNAVTVFPQPAANFVGFGTICQGNSFIINTNFAGTPPFSFTYNDGTSNHFVSGINTVVYGLGVSPTTTTTYRIVAINDAFCSASTADVASTSSTITVNNVSFIQQPANATGCVGNSVTLTSVATANTSFSYQWQKNGVDILGANNNTLTLSNINISDAGTYSVAIILPCGTVRSNTATLTVVAPAIPPAFLPVVTLCQFDTSKALVASGDNLSWYTAGVDGIASPVPPIPNTLFVGTQQYWVSNSNSVGCESQRYLITVNVLQAPTVSVAVSGNTTLLPSQIVTLSATASSNALGIRWYFNGQNIGSTPNNVLTVGFNGLGKYQAESVTSQGCTARSAINEVIAPRGLAPQYEGSNLVLYPNPITSFVNMYFDNPINQNATVRLVDVWGHELQNKTVRFTNRFQVLRIDVGNLTPGFYAVEISNAKGNTIARNLFVKAK